MIDILTFLLDSIRKAVNITPQPFQTQDYGDSLPAVTYSFYSIEDDGAVSRYRLLVRVHGSDYETAIQLTDKIRKELITVGDEYKNWCSIEINGGGSLIDQQTDIPQQITYYDITTRS